MKTKSKSNNNPIKSDDLCYEEQIEENGICELPVTGTPIAQFYFGDNALSLSKPLIKDQPPEILKDSSPSSDLEQPLKFTDKKVIELKDNRTLKSYPNGITPPVNGEHFDTKRSFTLRRSTVRLLIELKATHPDINVYLNSIVDKALRHYHEYIFEENGTQI